MEKHDTWKKKENLENVKKKIIAEFERKINAEIRQQKKLNMAKGKNFRRKVLPGKYTAKILYR